VDTFLIWRLTRGKVHVTDFSNASRTLLFNIHTLNWDDVILKELDIPRQMLPQADILGVPVERPKIAETTALGAAYLAGLATGFWHDQKELAEHWAIDRTFEPKMGKDQREGLYGGWKRAVERSLHWEVSNQQREALTV
jgi:glycerol kinase